jgi:ferrochelatase
MKKAVLLVNLGSPDSPSVSDVRRYLREFLMDGRVLDIPWPIRFCVVNFGILPSRPKQSAEAYEKVWTKAGSPLVAISRNLLQTVRKQASIPIELAMRYQNPSIPDAVAKLAGQGVDQLLVIPLFPHYAMSSFETAAERVKEVARRISPGMQIQIQPPFFEDADYLDALAASAGDYLKKDFDHLLFSFHGLPERHMKKADPTGCHCLVKPDCCQVASAARPTCYRAQCFATVSGFIQRTTVPKEKYSVSFQSRLGRDPWLKPYTDHVVVDLAQRGVKRLLVMCPAFVSDCLETLEEIGMRASESFHASGGTELTLIPCLNESPQWTDVLARMITQFQQGKVPETQRFEALATKSR